MRGRAPSLSERGRLLLGLAAALLLVGAALSAWAIVALGLAAATLLGAGYLASLPSALLLWRRHVELHWRLERAGGGVLIAGRPVTVLVRLRNRAGLPFGRVTLRALGSPALAPLRPIDAAGDALASDEDERAREVRVRLGASEELTLRATTHARAAGAWQLHGAVLELEDALGLTKTWAWFASPLAMVVQPRAVLRRSFALPPSVTRAGRVAAGRRDHAARPRLGPGAPADLRELRDHVPGDSFRRIAWKATARSGRLMVREDERVSPQRWLIAVDVSASMADASDDAPGSMPWHASPAAGPSPGKLDHAIELAADAARAALDDGDEVALCTFAGRVIRHVPSAESASRSSGHGHGGALLRLVEPLLEAQLPVEETLVDLTAGELYAVVARYLRHQLGVDVRLARAPAPADPRWATVATGPQGELYDLLALGQAIAPRLAKRKLELTLPRLADAADARLFCRAAGIELPRRRGVPGDRARGLAEVLTLAAAERVATQVLLISDLDGLGTLEADTRALAPRAALARARGHALTCLALDTAAFAPVAAPLAGPARQRAADILGWDEARRAAAARRLLAGLGVRVLRVARPADPAAAAHATPSG